MENRPLISSNRRQRSLGARATLCATLLVICVVFVGCKSTGGLKKSCLFGGGSCNEADERGQDPSQKEPTVPPVPEALPVDSKPIASASATVTSPQTEIAQDSTTAPNDVAFPNAIAIDSSRDAYVPLAKSPDYVQEPSVPNSANDSVVEAPAATPRPQYLSVAPSPNQEETNESRYLGFASPASDSSTTPLPNELRALGTLFGFDTPDELPDVETPLPADFAPVEKTVPSASPRPATNAPDLNPPVVSPSSANARVLPSQKEIESAYLTREPTSFRDYAMARDVESPGVNRSLYVDNTAATDAVTTPSPRANQGRVALPAAPIVSEAQNAPSGQDAQAAPKLRESRFFPGQYVGGAVDGSKPRAVAK